MCGIVGYIGSKKAYPVLIKGLHQLEYRGYDSAGVALIADDGTLNVYKAKGKVAALEHFAESKDCSGTIGIAHTRWATHGEPNDTNAHPHVSQSGNIAIVHNGTIENYTVIKAALEQHGYTFRSETDTEVVVQLIDYIRNDTGCSLFEAVRETCHQIIGAYAIAVMDRRNPDQIVVARKSSPLVIGIGDDEYFIASDATHIVEYTNRVVYLNDDEIAAFAKKVEEFTGNTITPEKLDEAIRLINEKRRALSRVFEARKNPDNIPISGTDALLVTQIAFFDDPARCAEMCNKLADELEERNRQGVSVFEKGTKRILITGTPMAIPNWKLHHIVETSGAAVVCEEMCTGTRYFENLVEEGLPTLDEQFMALSRRYMKNNCACFTPTPGRVEDILRLAREYHVDGVIDVNLKFCCLYDTEGYSVERALREAGIPVLGIETDYDDGDSEQLRTRIGAFVEMLG